MKFAIVASDLDGTLLSNDHNLTNFTKNTLRFLITHGVHFIFATGRHYINVIRICNDLQINSYVITSNGARVHNACGELVFSYNLDENIAYELLNVVYQDKNILTNVFRNDEWYVNRDRFDRENFFCEFGFNYKIYTKDALPINDICKVYFTSFNYQKLLMLENYLNNRWGNQINVSFSLPVCLEVVPFGVSKGHALKDVSRILGYDLQDCISFGDGMNDREMLSMTGKGCIMKNAHQRLKDALPSLEVIGSNYEDAVPHYLRLLYSEIFSCISVL